MAVYDKLLTYAENNLNVLLVGTHGIGKTTMAIKVAEELDLNLCYYSAATLDPFTDLVGVPKPVDGTAGPTLEFYRPQKIMDAEFLMFDELNRAHPRTLNAVLEIIQFKTINGEPLKNLKMVWAAINPPGLDYDVEDLDPALVDRFHTYVSVKAEFNMGYMKTKMSDDVAEVLRSWWRSDLDTHQRKLITPRRLEYMGMLIDKNIDWKEAIPYSATVVIPDGDLRRKLKQMKFGEQAVLDVSKENILANVDLFRKRLSEDPSEAIKIQEVMATFLPWEMHAARDLLEDLPKDFVFKIGRGKFAKIRREFYNLFKENNNDISRYPKIAESFKFSEY